MSRRLLGVERVASGVVHARTEANRRADATASQEKATLIVGIAGGSKCGGNVRIRHHAAALPRLPRHSRTIACCKLSPMAHQPRLGNNLANFGSVRSPLAPFNFLMLLQCLDSLLDLVTALIVRSSGGKMDCSSRSTSSVCASRLQLILAESASSANLHIALIAFKLQQMRVDTPRRAPSPRTFWSACPAPLVSTNAAPTSCGRSRAS